MRLMRNGLFVTLVVMGLAACLLLYWGSSSRGVPYAFLSGFSKVPAASSRNDSGGVVRWAYTGQADFEAVYADAKRELLVQGWHAGPDVLANYRSFSYRPDRAGTRDGQFGRINMWRDKRLEPNPVFQGKTRMNVAPGWVTVDCSEKRSPGLWEKMRSGLRRMLGL
jgi:hypothetical protein